MVKILLSSICAAYCTCSKFGSDQTKKLKDVWRSPGNGPKWLKNGDFKAKWQAGFLRLVLLGHGVLRLFLWAHLPRTCLPYVMWPSVGLNNWSYISLFFSAVAKLPPDVPLESKMADWLCLLGVWPLEIFVGLLMIDMSCCKVEVVSGADFFKLFFFFLSGVSSTMAEPPLH